MKEKKSLKEKLKEKFSRAMDWCKDNKEILIIVVPAATAAITGGVKLVGKIVDCHQEHNHQNLTCYDRSLGHYWQLKRELSNDEWVAIEQRRKNGERLADILTELKVLK